MMSGEIKIVSENGGFTLSVERNGKLIKETYTGKYSQDLLDLFIQRVDKKTKNEIKLA